MATEAAGDAASTKEASIPVSIAFSDDVAGPYPANYMCVAAGTDPCASNEYSQRCSVPAGPGKTTTFSCKVDASQLPDGPVTICVISADASVPDNPASANQSGTSMQANHSDEKCDTVTLDRSVSTPPDEGNPDPGTPDPGTPTPDTSTPDTSTPDTGTPTPDANPGIPGGLQIGSLSILVPKRVKIGRPSSSWSPRAPARLAGSRSP